MKHISHQNVKRNAIINYFARHAHVPVIVDTADFESDVLHDDAKVKEKENALCSAVSQLFSDKKGSMPYFYHVLGMRHTAVIPTGSLKLDLALGIGGLPKGRIIEIYGREASGKTTLAFQIIKEAQKTGGYCAYIDVENAMDFSFVKGMGIDPDTLLVATPNSAENLLSMVNTLTRTGSIDVIVLDSVAALVPQKELDDPIFGTFRDTQCIIMNQALRKISYSLCHSETLVIFLNQVRSKRKHGLRAWSAEETTCGGNVLNFHAAIQMRTARKELLSSNNEITGLGIVVEVVKNKLAPAMRKAELMIVFGLGVQYGREVFELACEHGVIWKCNGNYMIEDEQFEDEQSAESYLISNTQVCDRVVAILRSHLFKSSSIGP